MVAGDAPDVFFIWWSAGLMEEGQLLALDDYFDDEYMADFYEGNIVGQVYEGKLYGIPKYVSTVAMAYNKDILDAAGVAYPTLLRGPGTITWMPIAPPPTPKPDNGAPTLRTSTPITGSGPMAASG
ncbi:MAG: extracellular solute-binding protein [Caldilineaceae bacterium]